MLPELLVSNADAGLFIRAFTGPDGREGVSTILIETDDPKAVPRIREGDRALAPLARLLDEQDALLAPPVLGGDPGAYFTASDDPLPGALRSRLVRLLDEDERLYSDSLVFTNGPVLAVVTVWYPEDEGPVQDVEELAAGVQERVQDYLDQG